MGQYHNIINIDKQMQYSANSLANSVKLLEQGRSLTSVAALALLLANGWNGERVAIVGDYIEADDLNGIEDAVALCSDVDNNYKNVGWLARKVVQDAIGIDFYKDYWRMGGQKNYTYKTNLPDTMKVVWEGNNLVASGAAFDGLDNTEVMAFVNYDTNEKYIGRGRTMRTMIENFSDDFMTTVFILIAGSIRGGTRGGGDADHQMGGAWAGDRVGIIPNKDAAEFTDITNKVDNLAVL